MAPTLNCGGYQGCANARVAPAILVYERGQSGGAARAAMMLDHTRNDHARRCRNRVYNALIDVDTLGELVDVIDASAEAKQ